MTIEANSSTVTILGNIKSVSDFQTIKNTIDNMMNEHRKITIEIPDSLSITSSVIGYVNKLVLKDKIDITMIIGNQQLLDLLEDLNLTSVFKARKN